MKKAKALFAAGIIVVVAGMSAALWYLNDSGMLHSENTTEEYVDEYIKNDSEDFVNADVPPADNEKRDETQAESSAKNTDDDKIVDESAVNEFLSVFANVYFSEQGNGFDIEKCSDYELIQFAYLHIRNTDSSSVILEQRDDNIMYYYAVPFDKVYDVIEKYFGKKISAESAYTENDYAFFSYSDGYFYTPAADGLAYENTAAADSVKYENDHIVVQFSVYSGEEKYAEGEAKIQIKNDDMYLVSYQLYN